MKELDRKDEKQASKLPAKIGISRKQHRKAIMAVSAMIAGACCFCMIYGLRILDPTYTAWLMNNTGGGIDPAQHYLGWCFYRNSSWLFPLGMLDNIAYPLKTSIIFTDSIPAVALVFKALSPALPEEFQYFGLYGLFCFCMQSLFGALITFKLCSDGKEYGVVSTGEWLLTLLGGVFFTISPVLIDRMFHHTALASQWMILMAIWIFLKSTDPGEKNLERFLCWGILGYLAGAVHLYYLPMTGIFCVASAAVGVLTKKSIKPLLFPATYFGAALVAVWLFGGFSSGMSAEADGLGDYSFNLNGFINPAGRSALIKELSSAFPGQNEGFAYLGAGTFLLLATVFIIYGLKAVTRIFFYRNASYKESKHRDATYYGKLFTIILSIIVFVIMFVFSLSPVVTAAEKVLFIIPIHSKTRHLWNIFRSTGRMIWVCVYLLETIGIYGLLKIRLKTVHTTKTLQILILAACIMLQIYDLRGWLSEKRRSFTAEQSYETELRGKNWDALAKNSKHLIVSEAVTSSESRVMETAEWANENDLTLNNFYFARGLPEVREEYDKTLQNPTEEDLFLFTPEDPELGRAEETLALTKRGRYIIGIAKKNLNSVDTGDFDVGED